MAVGSGIDVAVGGGSGVLELVAGLGGVMVANGARVGRVPGEAIGAADLPVQAVRTVRTSPRSSTHFTGRTRARMKNAFMSPSCPSLGVYTFHAEQLYILIVNGEIKIIPNQAIMVRTANGTRVVITARTVVRPWIDLTA